MRAFVLILAVLAGAVLAAPMQAATPSPLMGPRGDATAAAERPDDGIAASIRRTLLDIQRTMVSGMARRMAAARDGLPGALWLALGLAFLYGAVHAAGPGHGKMVVTSYFVSREARVGRGLLMGVQIAVVHVVSAVIVVGAVDITYRQVMGGAPAESQWVRLGSYAAIALVGLAMVARAVWRRPGHGHRHGAEQGALSVLAGLVPCTGAILVMLYALANDMLALGIGMVIAISAGMAATMALLGLAAIVARRFVLARTRRGSRAAGAVALGLEIAGGLAITAVGAAFFLTAWHGGAQPM